MAHRRGVFGTVRDVSAFQPDQCSAGNTDLNPGGVRDGKTALSVLHGDFNLENLARRSVLIFRKKAGNGASGTESPGNPVGLHFQYAWSTDGRKLIAGVSFPAAHGDQRAGRVNRKGSRMERYLPADTVFAGRFLPDSETFPVQKELRPGKIGIADHIYLLAFPVIPVFQIGNPFAAGSGGRSFRPDCCQMSHRGFRPEAHSSIIAAFFKACQRQQSCAGSPIRPSLGFPQIIDAGPEKLPADVIVVRDRLPGFQTVAVFASKEGELRKSFMALLVEVLLVIVACHIQSVEKSQV